MAALIAAIKSKYNSLTLGLFPGGVRPDIYADFVPQVDSAAVERLKAAVN